MTAFNLGILLVVVGLIFLGGVWLVLKRISKQKSQAPAIFTRLSSDGSIAKTDAILVVRLGGKITYLNDQARRMFNLKKHQQPDFEHLTRQIRPGEALLNLCAAEGSQQFSINGKRAGGVSFSFYQESTAYLLVTIKYLESEQKEAFEKQSVDSRTIGIPGGFEELTLTNLSLETTILSVLKKIEEVIPSDFLGVSLWDETGDVLTLFSLQKNGMGEQRLEIQEGNGYPTEGPTAYIYKNRRPLLIPNGVASHQQTLLTCWLADSTSSYIGAPLIYNNKLIGALEIGAAAENAFAQKDLDLLVNLSRQIATVIFNAFSYNLNQRQAREYSILETIDRDLGLATSVKEIAVKTIQNITLLLDVNIIGILLYSKERHTLYGQAPFQGLPDQFVEIYQAEILPDSPAEKLISKQESLISDNAREDARWVDLGLDYLARAASICETIMAPLISAGYVLGYLQISNHKERSRPFSRREQNLALLIAGHIAPLIGNVIRVDQYKQQSDQLETVNRIITEVNLAGDPGELFGFSIEQVSQAIGADIGAIFMIDELTGKLALDSRSVFGISADAIGRLIYITMDNPQFHFTASSFGEPFVSGNLAEDQRVIIPFYLQFNQLLAAQSLIAMPLSFQGKCIGEMILGCKDAFSFGKNECDIVALVASQLSIAYERIILSAQTDTGLRQQIDQLTSLTRFDRQTSASLDIHYLTKIALAQIVQMTGANSGSIAVFDLNAATDEDPVFKLSLGDSLQSGKFPLMEGVWNNRDVLLISDFTKCDYPPLHQTDASALFVPFVSDAQSLGFITVYSTQPDQFNETSVELTEAIIERFVVALKNALRYQEQSQRGEYLARQVVSLSQLFEINVKGSDQSLEQTLNVIANAIKETTPFQAIIVCVFSREQNALQPACSVGLTPDAWDFYRSKWLDWDDVRCLYQPEFRISNSYAIPIEKILHQSKDFAWMTGISSTAAEAVWFVPLTDVEDEPSGVILAGSLRNGTRMDRLAIEALETIASRAALMIGAYFYTADLRREIQKLDNEVENLQQTVQTAEDQIQSITQMDLDKESQIRSLSWQSKRIQDSLDISEIVTRQSDVGSILSVLCKELITRMDWDCVLVAEPTPEGPHILYEFGKLPQNVNPDALLGQRNPIKQCLQDGQLVTVNCLSESPEWNNTPLLQALEAKGFVCLPLTIDDLVSASVLAVSQKAELSLTEEDEQVYSQLAHQVSIILQNQRLLAETRRRLREVNDLLEFSRKLGSLIPEDILKSLAESAMQAITTAHAIQIAIWDVNASNLKMQIASGYADDSNMLLLSYLPEEGVAGRTFTETKPCRIAEVDFARDYNLSADNLMLYRKATGGLVPVSTIAVPILIGEKCLGVLEQNNFTTSDAFSVEDETLLISLSQQTALALENARLFQASEQRAGQLQALTNVSGLMTSSLQSENLIASLLEQLQSVIPYATATLWLRRGEKLNIVAARGFTDNDERVGLSISVDDSQLFKDMIATQKAISVPDVRLDARFPSYTEQVNFSWLGVPLLAKNELIGVIALEETSANFYTSDHILAAMTFAGQAAAALENARLFEESINRSRELDERSNRLILLNRLSSELSASLDQDYILKYTTQELLHALDADLVSVILFEEGGQVLLSMELPDTQFDLLTVPQIPLFDHLRQSLGVYIAVDVFSDKELVPLDNFFRERGTQSLLILPLTTASLLHGLIFIQNRSEHHFSTSEIELARTISNHAAISLQNARMFTETFHLTEDLEHRVQQRTAELSRQHQYTESLLEITKEISSSLDLSQILDRTLELLNGVIGSELSTVMLLPPNQDQFHYRQTNELTEIQSGYSNNLAAWIKAGLGGWVVFHREEQLIDDLLEDSRWSKIGIKGITIRSGMAVPLLVGEEVLGALLLFHRQSGRFSAEHLNLTKAVANQVAVAIHNAELYTLIRDQAERLGNMLRDQQVETSRSRAILEAVADGVLVTDSSNIITLFNASAERILDLDVSKVHGVSLDYFRGLFGKVGGEWIKTIQKWSENPRVYQTEEVYVEEIVLESGRVVSIHLSPVFLIDEFFGTVSIFRDITREVEVDRMKSDFVANVSHELRTPMTSIKGYVEIMLMGIAGPVNEQQKNFLTTVKNNIERLSILVNDLLDISRIESRRVTPLLEPLDIKAVAQEVLDEFKQHSIDENKPMTFSVEIDQDTPPVYADPDFVHKALRSLVSNSYHYTPENGHIQIQMRRTANEVQVDVIDDGIGIRPVEQNRIFERFYRGDNPLVLATAGTGLGLSMVKTLIEMLQGRIWFKSSGVSGEGSVFSFTLPVYEVKSQDEVDV
jgi:GAF domain-containing protein/signal transduction histidine kinase